MPRHRYANLSRQSGVAAYEAGPDFIRVEFVDGGVYLYTHASAGRPEVETMKELARRGQGLATFISRFVRDGYARREVS